jgi:phosphatidylserine/phosphatidylglycerophosphate/cardiolipin synthase-like enzyme
MSEETGVFSSVPISPQSPESYFSPDGGISSRIVQQIERARSSIDIEIYTFTRTEIMNALIAARAKAWLSASWPTTPKPPRRVR